MADQGFDVVVLGGGVASQSIVYRLRDAGKSVAVVDAGALGGTCANTGCDAKKPYVNAAQRVLQSRAMVGHGLVGEIQMDWKALVDFKRSFTDPVPDGTRNAMREAGIEVYEGEPRFTDPHTIQVNGESIRGEQIVIATGGKPRPLDLPGAEHVIDSDGFLELDELPPRVVFIGGGYISMEFAGVAAVAGAKVTVLQSGEYPLEIFDRDAVRVLLNSYNDLGIDVLTNRRAATVEVLPAAAGYRVTFADGAPPVEADLVVAAAGRVPSIGGLGLDAIGVEHGPRGVVVDNHLRCPAYGHLWAAGDVADNGRAPLTPTASEDGRVVAHNLMNEAKRTQITTPIVSVAFTLPSIARVGLSEAEAAEACGPIEVVTGDMSRWKHYRQQGEKHAYFKLVFCQRRQTLQGAHLVGAECQEVINVMALAMGEACDRQTLIDTTFGYPTVAFNLISKIKKQTASGG
jgi:glutathione reductase (NADPH)